MQDLLEAQGLQGLSEDPGPILCLSLVLSGLIEEEVISQEGCWRESGRWLKGRVRTDLGAGT